MSNRALASHLRRTVDGPMWHGPALMELLSTISVTQASARPIASAHTIAELVLHMTAWANIARERLHSPTPVEATPEQDWPTATGLDASGWHDALAQLRAAYDALAKEVETHHGILMKSLTTKEFVSLALILVTAPVLALGLVLAIRTLSGGNEFLLLALTLCGAAVSGLNGFGRRTAKVESQTRGSRGGPQSSVALTS